MTQHDSASLAEERASVDRTYERVGAGRRAMGFVLAVALTGGGSWLFYRNLIYGDVVSVTIALLAALMIGAGTFILPASILGRRDW